ncbi:MAG: ATP-binding protein [Clostridia bacterium]|nr:ATP-binding protein [Clostridia bacterium]
MIKEITKIVITGGPCGGKTTASERIREFFSKKGYTVVFIPETATELILGGIAPWTTDTNQTFQHTLLMLQLEKEKYFTHGARLLKKNEKLLIVCDRGALDNKAYTTGDEFSNILTLTQLTEEELLARYDAVFHLTTAAKGAEEFYTFSNNNARYETIDEARALDDRLIDAWKNHPNYFIIDNSTDFEGKLNTLIDKISSFLKTKKEAADE